MKKDKDLVRHHHVGIIKMKNIYLAYLAIGFGVFSYSALSQQTKIDELHHVDMKCFTEVLGGDFMIHRNYEVPIKQLKHYSSLVKEMSISARKNNQSKVIYKVIECKKMHESFSNKDAIKLDKLERDLG